MTEGTLLLSIDDVTVHQLSQSSATSILLSQTTLKLLLLDIPSTALKSIPSVSEPPAYNQHSVEKSNGNNQATVETWLVISLADRLIDIPLSQSTNISFQLPRSYLVPILPGDSSSLSPTEIDKKAAGDQATIRIDIADHIPDDTIDTFDSILAGWTRYPGRQNHNQTALSPNTQTPINSVPPPPPHPSSSSGFPKEKASNHNGKAAFPSEGRLALMDESTGEICGELTSNVTFQGPAITAHAPPYPAGPSSSTHPGGSSSGPPHILLAAPQPVMVSMSSTGQGGQGTAQVSAIPISGDGSSQILNGAEWVSRGILAGSEVINKVLGFTKSASIVSGKTAALVGSVLGKVGDQIGKSTGIQRSPTGAPPSGARGYVHKGLVAFNTVMDSIETGGKKVLYTAGDTTTEVVTHAYGAEAGQIAHRANHAVRNVGLVYIDARGVTRRAILKSVGKAAVRGRMNDGREVILGSDENVDHHKSHHHNDYKSHDHKDHKS
ncbi:hypothetical protein KEM48_005120 [Puccinia striiformis f. sp. tritici PST-130]|nr:hypothetical protein KEM48_005120 [Puccinia striiformis f. sp. tritici PST-130]